MDKTGVVMRNPLFAGLTERQVRACLAACSATVKSYRKGELLHRGGTAFRQFGIVLSGTVYVLRMEADGEETLMNSVTVGQSFGESHCILQSPQPNVWVQATEDCEVLWLSAQKLCGDGEMAARFTRMLAQRTLMMNDRIQILSKRTIREKLMTLFSLLARQAGGDTFNAPFDRSGMATYLGSDRSAVSRELARLKREGRIDYYRNSFRILKK